MKRKNSKPLVHTETIREVKDIENHNNPPATFFKRRWIFNTFLYRHAC